MNARDVVDRPRLPYSITELIEMIPGELRILELGPYDGRHTLDIARLANELVLIESRIENIRTTLAAVADVIVGESFSIIRGDLESMDLARLGKFHAVLCSGVIYHMSKPWELIRKVSSVTNCCLGWSHVSGSDEGERNGYHGKPVIEDTESPLAGMTSESWWLTTDEFERAFMDAGFLSFRWIEYPTAHPNGGMAGWFEASK